MRRTSVSPTPASRPTPSATRPTCKANWQPGPQVRARAARRGRQGAGWPAPIPGPPRGLTPRRWWRCQRRRRLAGACPRAAGHQAGPGQRALRSARQRLGCGLDRLRARAEAGVKAAALWVLHEALKRRSYWRPAIDAVQASLALVDDAPRRARRWRRWSPSTASASSSTRWMPIRRCRACASSSPSGWRPASPTGRSISRSTARTRRR